MAALKIDAPTTSPLTSKGSAGPAPAATDFHQFASLRRAADAHDPKADISTLKTFAVESGKPGVVTA